MVAGSWLLMGGADVWPGASGTQGVMGGLIGLRNLRPDKGVGRKSGSSCSGSGVPVVFKYVT